MLFGLDTQTLLLIIIAFAIFGKPVIGIIAKFFPVLIPFIPLLEKLTANGNGKEEKVPEWAQQLQAHYNEETTEVLKRIEAKTSGIHDGVLAMNVKLDAIEPCRK